MCVRCRSYARPGERALRRRRDDVEPTGRQRCVGPFDFMPKQLRFHSEKYLTYDNN